MPATLLGSGDESKSEYRSPLRIFCRCIQSLPETGKTLKDEIEFTGMNISQTNAYIHYRRLVSSESKELSSVVSPAVVGGANC